MNRAAALDPAQPGKGRVKYPGGEHTLRQSHALCGAGAAGNIPLLHAAVKDLARRFLGRQRFRR